MRGLAPCNRIRPRDYPAAHRSATEISPRPNDVPLLLKEVQVLKTEVIRAKCTPEERAVLLQIAHNERRNPSEALREAVREMATRRGLWPPQEEALKDAA